MARLTDFVRGFFARGDFIEIKSAAYEQAASELYYKELAIKQAVSIIATIIGKCEIKVYINGEAYDKGKEYYKWNIAPNVNQNGSEFLAKIVEEMLLCNHALVFETGENRFCADNFGVEMNGLKPYEFTNVVVNGESLQNNLKRKDVLYFKLDNAELTRLIDNMYASYGEVLTLAINSYKQSSGTKWKLKVSAAEKASPNFNKTYTDITQNSLKTFFTASNAVYPEFDGYELSEITPKPAGVANISEITALRKDIFNSIAAVYKIPLSIMNGEKVSDDDKKQLQTDCIEPIVSVIGKELTKQMFTFEQWQNSCYFEVDITNIEHLPLDKLAGACEKLIGSGTMNIDEVRTTILGLKALNTEYSKKYWITKNFSDIEKANNSEGGADDETDLST